MNNEPEPIQQHATTLALQLVMIMQQLGGDTLEIPDIPGDSDTAFNLSINPVGRTATSNMTLNEYQAHALRTAPAEGANHFFSQSKLAEHELAQNPPGAGVAASIFRSHIDLLHACMGMAGEAGETVDLVKKSMFYGKPLDRDKLIKEAGDQLWYIAGPFCRAMGITFEQLAAVNVAKLQERYQGTYTDKAAIARRDVQDKN